MTKPSHDSEREALIDELMRTDLHAPGGPEGQPLDYSKLADFILSQKRQVIEELEAAVIGADEVKRPVVESYTSLSRLGRPITKVRSVKRFASGATERNGLRSQQRIALVELKERYGEKS